MFSLFAYRMFQMLNKIPNKLAHIFNASLTHPTHFICISYIDCLHSAQFPDWWINVICNRAINNDEISNENQDNGNGCKMSKRYAHRIFSNNKIRNESVTSLVDSRFSVTFQCSIHIHQHEAWIIVVDEHSWI